MCSNPAAAAAVPTDTHDSLLLLFLRELLVRFQISASSSRPIHWAAGNLSKSTPECTHGRLVQMELIVIAMILLLLLGALFVIPRSNRKGKARGTHPSVTTKTIRTYTKEEVSLHNTRTDCWIIVKDKVYNVTPYVEEHPGGDAILNNAGGDSTKGFYGSSMPLLAKTSSNSPNP
ncbi:hypothetical protein C4D60_Mb09t04610 [Musa balbisiana]|uniref:Cytochrome b5 heme-binding domain-containing protein n=1 Tax=Musa balbisiana TaxID=52838 RepID=A0A4V4H303_MUSBA|nr:hypothetical protein C4D60_Mb09t04610 [Musa balbisiana]